MRLVMDIGKPLRIEQLGTPTAADRGRGKSAWGIDPDAARSEQGDGVVASAWLSSLTSD